VVHASLRAVGPVAGGARGVIRVLDEAVGQADYFAMVLRDHIGPGRAHHGVVGDAESMLIDARNIVSFGAAWVTENLAPR
jgi:aminoglycoside N3'-acetyltransferase